jgi:hypothetical protein
MKKVVLLLVLVCVVAGGAFAEWYNSYAEGVAGSKIFINGGIGLGYYSGYNIKLPPITASVDFALPMSLPITVGAFFSIDSYGWDYFGATYTFTRMAFGARGAYHVNLLKNFDIYGGLALGAWTLSSKYNSNSIEDTNSAAFYIGGFLGARWYFANFFGIYLELGYSGLAFAQLGVTFKF